MIMQVILHLYYIYIISYSIHIVNKQLKYIIHTVLLDLEGTIYLSLDGNFDKVFPYLPRFGLGLKLPNDKTDVTYNGYGPYESYSDKHRASWVDRFDTTVDDMFEDYVFPQENGNHYNCQYASVGNLYAKGKKPFSF